MIVWLPRLKAWINLGQIEAANDEGSSISARFVGGAQWTYAEPEDIEAIRQGLNRMAAAFAGAFVVAEDSGEVGG